MPFQQPFIQKQVNLLHQGTVHADVLRLDAVHPVISGNKWFKLKNYLAAAAEAGKKNILSFGGAYSNHIVATAGACKQFGFKATGIIRGEEAPALSHTLLKARELGMELHFVPRHMYRDKAIPIHIQQEDYYIIPEGGYGKPGAKGFGEMLAQFDLSAYSHIFCATGTGTMLAGLVEACPPHVKAMGVPVLKNINAIESAVNNLLTSARQNSFELVDGYHFNGYAKYDDTLIDYMNSFYAANTIPTDFVYTGKLFFAVSQLTLKQYYIGKKILVIHSGGLQGNLSLPPGTLMF